MLNNYIYSAGLYAKVLLIQELKDWKKEKEKEGLIPTIELLLEEINQES